MTNQFTALIENQVLPITHIYVDLDGVLTNFEGMFKSIQSTAPKLTSRQYTEKYSEKKFWDLINSKGSKFWSDMEWIEGGKELINYLDTIPSNIIIKLLSTPSYENSSKVGKIKWVKNHLNNKYPLVFSFEKAKYATPTSILIDDYKKNIASWNEANGIGILHKDIKTTLSQLKQYMKEPKIIKEKSWNMKDNSNNSNWAFVMNLMNEWEQFDDSTDNLEQSDAINKELAKDLIDKIKSFEPKLGAIKNQEYDIVIYFLEHAKTVDQFESAWTKFQEFMQDNKIFVKTFRTNND